ncbi:formate dehydrogenase accessory sulfurtransferase FdhD [Thalassotalea euphylliae]|uniref:formate dehydrogenase accessory sulfurtransferase FdhD n=1 Tax=Thalassotalea euphylliae TaxID=1655234 RepID=UPI00362F2F30
MTKHALITESSRAVVTIDNGKVSLGKWKKDVVASEQPLQLMLNWFGQASQQWQSKQLAIVMRSPGDDKALVIGFLLTQQVIACVDDIKHITFSDENVADITLVESFEPDWQALARIFVSHSGCGVCGQSQLKQLATQFDARTSNTPWLSMDEILTLPAKLQSAQAAFVQTGGMHGAGLAFEGNIQLIAEDVGRHNAVDKVIGQLHQHKLAGELSEESDLHLNAEKSVLVLSGRISFELVQKAVVANIGAIIAVGAPSDLAIATAQQFNLPLIGFVKPTQANVYYGYEQLILPS